MKETLNPRMFVPGKDVETVDLQLYVPEHHSWENADKRDSVGLEVTTCTKLGEEKKNVPAFQ